MLSSFLIADLGLPHLEDFSYLSCIQFSFIRPIDLYESRANTWISIITGGLQWWGRREVLAAVTSPLGALVYYVGLGGFIPGALWVHRLTWRGDLHLWAAD